MSALRWALAAVAALVVAMASPTLRAAEEPVHNGTAQRVAVHVAAPSMLPDFNGDGYPDVATGDVDETVGSDAREAGAVSVLYGGPNGPQADTPDDQFWTQDSPGVLDDSEAQDHMGRGIAAGDFNGDGFSDASIGVFGETVSPGAVGAGAVAVLYGSAAGLQADAPDDQLWTQDSPGVQDVAETQDALGWSMTSGDFNADGYDDMAAGARYEDVGAATDAGAVMVLYGSPAGLQADAPDDQLWTQDSPSVKDRAESNDEFGRWLTGGDFNADGYADLAMGTRGESIGATGNAGAVNVLYGSALGLQAGAPDDQAWTQDSPGVKDRAEPGDWFGNGVTSGDLNADGYDDLAVGSLHEAVGTVSDAGAISVLYGSALGLQAGAPDDQFWTQDSPSVKDHAEVEDQMGVAVEIGDFNADGFGDLVMGVLKEDVGGVPDAGAFQVLYGSASGVQATMPDDQYWTQDSPGVEDVAEMDDEFGHTLMAADFNRDGFTDLAIGSPHEDLGNLTDTGAISVFFGSSTGLQVVAPPDQYWTQDSPGVMDEAELQDVFGRTLAQSP